MYFDGEPHYYMYFEGRSSCDMAEKGKCGNPLCLYLIYFPGNYMKKK